jgi:hypothetical protein
VSIDRVTQSVKRKKENPASSALVLGAATHMRASLENLRGGFILVLLEVLHEQLAKLIDLFLEIGRTIPGFGRVEQLVRNVGASLWYRQAEGLVGLELDLGELAGVNGVQNGSGVFPTTRVST